MSGATRIAMWSGPRNISTAMMRAWGNRGDTAVWDEPLYAFYLHRTGIDHPGAGEVIAAGDKDWRRVVAAVTGPVPDGKPIYFQKHMTHHMLDEIDRDWLAQMHNCFLIRDPREVIASSPMRALVPRSRSAMSAYCSRRRYSNMHAEASARRRWFWTHGTCSKSRAPC